MRLRMHGVEQTISTRIKYQVNGNSFKKINYCEPISAVSDKINSTLVSKLIKASQNNPAKCIIKKTSH